MFLVYRYKLEVAGKSLPALTNSDKGRYSVVVFENYHRYLNMDKWNRELLDKYCREYGVGILGFFPQTERRVADVQVKGFPLYLHTKLSLRVRIEKNINKILKNTKYNVISDTFYIFILNLVKSIFY